MMKEQDLINDLRNKIKTFRNDFEDLEILRKEIKILRKYRCISFSRYSVILAELEEQKNRLVLGWGKARIIGSAKHIDEILDLVGTYYGTGYSVERTEVMEDGRIRAFLKVFPQCYKLFEGNFDYFSSDIHTKVRKKMCEMNWKITVE